MPRAVPLRSAPLRSAGRSALAVLLSAALVGPLHGGLAGAQTPAELKRAREQFREGLALEAGGNCAKALESFRAVAEVKSTPQVRMHIAQCEEKTGDYVKALGSYRLALVDAQAGKVKDVIELANESIAALEPKIPSITIGRGEGAGVASIRLDERELGGTEIGSKMPVNPGPHVIEATSPGMRRFRTELSLGDGEKKTIEVILTPVADPGPGPDPTVEPTATAPPPPTSSPMRTAGFVIGGIGLAGLALGGAFIGVRQGTLSELESKCGADHKGCPPDANSVIARGELESNLVNGGLIGGGVLVAVGLILVVVAPKSEPAATAAKWLGITPGVAGSRQGATLSFTF
jgi:hypothetical protein